MMVGLIILMFTVVLAVLLVNLAYRLFAKIVGAGVFFFRLKTKLMCYFVVWLILMAFLSQFCSK
jgi:hypothetical protein